MNPLEEYESRVRGHQLAELRWHWGEAYEITWRNGAFRAIRRDNHAAVSAAEFARIHQLIIDDYAAKPVPRPAWSQR